MTIIFEPLTTPASRGRSDSRFELSYFARAELLVASAGEGSFLLGYEAVAAVGSAPVPVVPSSQDGSFVLAFDATGDFRNVGASELLLQMSGTSYAGLSGSNTSVGEGEFVLYGDAAQFTAPGGVAFFVEQPAFVQAFGDLQVARVKEALLLGAAQRALPISVMVEALALRGAQGARADVLDTITEGLSFGETLEGVRILLVEEGIAFGTAAVLTAAQVARVVERLLLSGAVDTYAEAIDTLVVGLAFGTVNAGMQVATAQDTVVLASSIRDTVIAMSRLVESLLMASAGEGEGLLVAVVREGIRIGGAPGPGTIADVAALITESVSFVARLTIDNGEYIAWVLNTESRGLSRYTQFPFNSFAKIGDTYFAADSSGLHRLTGDTDNGEPIKARLRTGLQDFGTRRLKRLPEVFTATSGGSVYLKVITVAEDGEKEAAIYRMRDRPAGAKRENRIAIGRGLKAVDWAFELENVDGAELDIRSLEFRPLMLDRRTRG